MSARKVVKMYPKKEEYRLFEYNLIKVQEIAPGIITYDGVIPNYETLVNDIEEGMVSAKREWVGARVKEGSESHLNTDSRDTLTTSVPYSDKVLEDYSTISSTFNTTLSNLFLKHLGAVEIDYQKNFSIRCSWHDSYQILKYGVGQKFVNHIDDHPDFHRRISTLYYLNDDYSGGEINFPRFNISFKPKPNQMIIFPSTYVYNHSVSPVTEGTRYAVVSWLR
jgi:predicted 2-oxoglutarate/Fe(II)-dependent dioxygenase YbiX